MKEQIVHSVNQVIQAAQQLSQPRALEFIQKAAHLIASSFQAGKKVLIAGNGGSLCDAVHFAEELTGFFREQRPALPAIALTESAHLTCTANDIGFEWVFARGVEALGQPEDVFIGLSTSGNSPNVIKAFEVAKKQKLRTIAFLGKTGGALKGIADLELIIEGFTTSDRIQEAHMAAMHIIIEVIELHLFLQKNPQEAWRKPLKLTSQPITK